MTFEEIIAAARENNWKNRRIKDALYEAGMPQRRDEALALLGREKGPANMPPATPASAIAAAPVAVAEDEASATESPDALAAPGPEPEPVKLEDGCTIFCDAAQNVVKKVVNGYGRQKKFDNGGYRIGLKSGAFSAVFFNTVCPDAFAGECFAVLKSIEVAAQQGLKNVTISSDRIGGFEATTKRGYAGAKYLWVAKKIAAEAGLAVSFARISGEENEADAVSRRNI